MGRRDQLTSIRETFLNANHPMRSQLAAAAQQVYDAWQLDDEGYDWQVGAGGICHLIADAMQDVLWKYNVWSTSQSCSMGEVHVNVIAQFREGVYVVDIDPYDYETGGGYTWKKLPDIIFTPDFVTAGRIDPNPFNLREYVEEYEGDDVDEDDDDEGFGNFGRLGLPTQVNIRDLTNAAWSGDDDARFILADAYDEIGRRDIAMLWRDELPGYRRRKKVVKLTLGERDEIRSNMQWLNANVQYRTGPSDEQLALAAIGCMYRMNARRHSIAVIYPRIIWVPAPPMLRQTIHSQSDPSETLGPLIWRPTLRQYLNTSINVNSLITLFTSELFDSHIMGYVIDAADEESFNLRHGLSRGQFDAVSLREVAIIDVLRLSLGDDLVVGGARLNTIELSIRAQHALLRCTPCYYPFEHICLLAQHPAIIDQDSPFTLIVEGQARWAWLDSDNRPHQWPTTR